MDDPQELISHPNDILAVHTWLETAYGTRGSTLLIVGTPGCGASTMLTSLLRRHHIEPVWFAPGTAKLRASLKDAGVASVSASGNRKILVVEGFDSLMTDANAAADVSDFIGRCMPAPVVFLGHRTRTVFKRFQELFKAATRHRATVVELTPLEAQTIADVLVSAGAVLDPAVALTIATEARGDVRSAFAAASFLSTSAMAVKDAMYESYSVVDMVLEGSVKSVKEALALASGDPTVVSLGIFEAYGFSPDIAEAFSCADVLEEFMFGRQRWELADAHAALSVAYPAVTLSALKLKAPTPLKNPTTAKAFSYGMVWSRAHLQASKARLLKNIATQRADSGLPALLSVQDLAWIRTMVTLAEARRDGEALRTLLEGLKPPTVLAIMRLWKSSYTQSAHARVIKMLKG